MDELAAPGDRGARGPARPLPPREPAPLRDRVARARARLVRLAPALVGPPDPDLDVPGRPPDLDLAAARRPAPSAASTELERETDVLDTWFSSALWPFATLGWPEQTPELDRYYPGDVNVTAREIIRLWENRMIFSGLFLLGEVPFTDVIINSTVLAVDGRRMSKSLGTGIDPLEAVAQARRRRDPLRAAEDLLDAGRPLQLGRDRGGREAREQALERRAADPRRRPRASQPELRPRALEETWIAGADRRDARARSRSCCRGSTSRTSPTRSTT